ncbi:MAG: hypothetical protein KDA41_22780, partial [Planctomycetales bacterium]|nr:hypothetical protein [Planctomycetales bacterium]
EANRKLVDDYAQFVETEVVALVGRAMQASSPATLKWGSGTATFAVNRRNNPEKDAPALR